MLVSVRSAQRATKLAACALIAAGAAFAGCSSKSDLTCGAGTTRQGNQCVAGAVEAGLLDASPDGEELDAGPAAGPPVFAGITGAAPVSETAIMAAWLPATGSGDPSSPAVGYHVYLGTSAPLDYTTLTASAPPGATTAVLGGLTAQTTYTIGVRAINASGIEDTNTLTTTATTALDTTPPTFSGAVSAAPGGSGAVTIAWAPASDDLTPASAITYAVYAGDAPGTENLAMPVAISAPGATSVTVTGLPNSSQTRYFVVMARDAAGNVSSCELGATCVEAPSILATNLREVSSTPGPDTQAPSFGGCTIATNISSVTIAVGWQPATDDVSPPENIEYQVLASTTPGDIASFSPVSTVTGADSAAVAGLQPNTQYYFICRAVDQAGNVDSNTVEVSATTGKLSTPPVFNAALSATACDPVGRTATISWDTAPKDPGGTTDPDEFVYQVYAATTSMGENTNAPPLTTSTGGNSIAVSNIPPNATVYFVVCTIDDDGSRACASTGDAGAALSEATCTTNVSFALNMQPILTQNCGVVGCHYPGNPTGGLILAPGFAYTQIVGVPAIEATNVALKPDAGLPAGMDASVTTNDAGTTTFSLDYVSPGDFADSYVYIKTHAAAFAALSAVSTGRFGTVMPAPATGGTLTTDDLDIIQTWIAQGAPNN